MSAVMVVGVDGSSEAADAIALGQRLARAGDARMLLAYVHPFGRLESVLSSGDYARLVADVADRTVAHVESLAGGPQRSDMRLVANDSPSAGLLQVAESEDATLIVVGSSRRSGPGRIRPGSVAERLLAGSPIPIAVAPRGYASESGGLARVAAAFDGSPQSRHAVEWAHRLTRATGASLRVITVYKPMAFGGLSAEAPFRGETVNEALRAELRRVHEEALAELGDEIGRAHV